MNIVQELRNKTSRDNRDLLDRAANEIERLQAENERLRNQDSSPKKISVQAALGLLTAEIGGDPDYPEIFVYLERKDGIQIDLVAASQSDPNREDISAYLYEDTSTDAYTKSYSWSKEELEIEA